MSKFVGTTNEFAAKAGIDYQAAVGTLKFLVARGIAVKVSNRKNITGKGKPSAVFEVPLTFTIDLTVAAPVAPEPVAAPEPVSVPTEVAA